MRKMPFRICSEFSKLFVRHHVWFYGPRWGCFRDLVTSLSYT